MRVNWAKVTVWALAITVAAVVVGVPVWHGRTSYEQYRRLRVVADGRVYRSGQMTADGFREAARRYGLKTVINLQDDDTTTAEDERDPLIAQNPLNKAKVRESEVMAGLGVRYVQLDGSALNGDGTGGRPKLVDDFLRVLDDEGNYPLLLHCKAGLHRTGWLTAIYRMEYERRPREEALAELKANGHGDFKATDANEYVKAYIFDFKRGDRASGYEWPAVPARGTPCGGAK